MAADPNMLTEASPLLEERRETSNSSSRTPFLARTPRSIVLLLSLNILCLATGGSLSIVPVTRILEGILCHGYYDGLQEQDGSIDERLCKIDEIQSKLAYLNGILSMIEAIIGLVVAFPYGILADRIGRKPVFVLSMLGTLLTLVWVFGVLRFWQVIPVRLIWIAPFFQAIGGGNTVIVAVTYSIVADVELEANRASAFLFMAFASLSGNLIGPLISSKLMEIGSPWTPLVVAFITTTLAMSLIIFVPETLRLKNNTDEDASQGPKFFSSMKLHLQHNFARLTESFSILRSLPLALILLTFLVQAPIILAVGQFFVQYVSKRFDWTLSKTGYLLSIRGIISIIVLLIALPGLSKLLLSPYFPFRFSPSRKDYILAQSSALFLTLGSLLLAGSDISLVILGVVVITLGGGLAPLCRSLLTAFIDSQHTSRLYTLIGIVESVGSLCAGPALAWFFTMGMKLKGQWLGLPYFWLALVCALATIALCFVGSAAEPTETPGAEETEESNLGEEYEAGT